MLNKTKSVARSITSLSSQERRSLFAKARTRLRKKGFHLKVTPSPIDFGRILIVTPKKVGNAVVRNKLRRQIRNCFYANKLYERKLDVLLFLSSEAAQLSYQEIESLLNESIQ